ncbi:acyl-CoA dehydrogenase [Sphingorhabdus soli]|uniref:3-methylmercaptopropionyl-CoA dehydrogenase n=1 Tax=Flavisphingopyxis soli TaxID=2601267 RepID=A0A5C6UM11_9SPHN|nr:acyl-CoA dehydrogenase [Sphingorhabdus soli]TXC73574.1 acyl-CoA dehydrogenase [Sphingorhabdus soli]
MTYAPPVAEQLFVLKHVALIDELAAHERFTEATPDMVEAIVSGVGDFASGEYAPLNRVGDQVGARWDAGQVTMPPGFREAYAAFVASGWGSLDGPVAYGGQGLPFSLFSVMMEDLGTANMGFSLVNMLTPAAIEALHAHGSEAQKTTYLPKLISGEWTGTMNLTEPQAGSDVGALKTMATPVESGDHAGQWRVKGTKIFITFGEHDLTDNIVHLVLARTPDAPPGTRGISLFLVPKYRLDADGAIDEANDVACVSIEHKLGIHASPTCVMSFGDHDACYGELVGDLHGGMRAMFTMMNNARLNVGNQGMQIAERATQSALAYAAERIQGSRTRLGPIADTPRADVGPVAIIEHPDVRRMLIRMKALTQAARALTYYAAGQADRASLGLDGAQARVDILTPLVKAYGTDIGCEVASLGVQVHGGMGYVEETGAAQHYRDARIAPIYEGTNGIQAADLVGRKMTIDGGAAIKQLIDDIRSGAKGAAPLALLADDCAEVAAWMQANASSDDRLAGSTPFLTMLSVATCGWLMTIEVAALDGDSTVSPDFVAAKRQAASFYIDQIVPQAAGLKAAAMAGAAPLYAVDAATLIGRD